MGDETDVIFSVELNERVISIFTGETKLEGYRHSAFLLSLLAHALMALACASLHRLGIGIGTGVGRNLCFPERFMTDGRFFYWVWTRTRDTPLYVKERKLDLNE